MSNCHHPIYHERVVAELASAVGALRNYAADLRSLKLHAKAAAFLSLAAAKMEGRARLIELTLGRTVEDYPARDLLGDAEVARSAAARAEHKAAALVAACEYAALFLAPEYPPLDPEQKRTVLDRLNGALATAACDA